MEPVNEVLRAYSADEMVCKVWLAAMEKTLASVLQAPAPNPWFEMVYPRVDVALHMADTITEAFIVRFRTAVPVSAPVAAPGDIPAE